MKKNILTPLLIFLIVISTGWSYYNYHQNVLAYTPSYNFKINDPDKIEETLQQLHYKYSDNINKRSIAIAVFDKHEGIMNEYEVANGAVININIPKGENFVISLPANKTIEYTWNITNKLGINVIEFQNRSWIPIYSTPILKDAAGTSYDRQNFYFESINIGSENIKMKYAHQSEARDEFFEFTIKVTITE